MIRTRHLLMGLCLIVLMACAGCKKSAVAPLGTPTPISGWEKFVGIGVEIWLPERYALIDMVQDRAKIAEALETRDPDLAHRFTVVEEQPEAAALTMYDDYSTVVVGATRNSTLIRDSIEDSVRLYAQTIQRSFPYIRILKQGTADIGQYRAGQLLVEYEHLAQKWKQIVFIVNDGTTMWALIYSAESSAFDSLLPEFDLSARTFVILPQR